MFVFWLEISVYLHLKELLIGMDLLDFPRGSDAKESICNAMETQFQSLGQEDPVEKGMITTPVFLPGEFNVQRILLGYIVHGVAKSETLMNEKKMELLLPFSSFSDIFVIPFSPSSFLTHFFCFDNFLKCYA